MNADTILNSDVAHWQCVITIMEVGGQFEREIRNVNINLCSEADVTASCRHAECFIESQSLRAVQFMYWI